jgi:hypothetical protein
MDNKNKPDNKKLPNGRVDLSELLELTEGNSVLVSKYISIFINSVRVELDNLQLAVNRSDGNLLYHSLHTLKPQIELMGIKGVLPELKLTEANLLLNKDMTEKVVKSANFIFTEITLACQELQKINSKFTQ